MKPLDPVEITNWIKTRYNVSNAQVESTSRMPRVVKARQAIVYGLRTFTGLSTPEIAPHAGYSTHSSVITALQKYHAKCDPEERERFHDDLYQVFIKPKIIERRATGIKDAHGKEIHTGDQVKILRDHPSHMKINPELVFTGKTGYVHDFNGCLPGPNPGPKIQLTDSLCGPGNQLRDWTWWTVGSWVEIIKQSNKKDTA